MIIKDTLKKNDTIRRIVKKYKIKKEFLLDYKDFIEYYNDSQNETIKTIEYKILLIVHSLEKGMCHSNLRPFGEKKIEELIALLKKHLTMTSETSSSYQMGLSIIDKWIEIYDINNFEKETAYQNAVSFMKEHNNDINKNIRVGAYEYKYNEFKESNINDYCGFLKSRHSIREFSDKALKKEDLDYCINSALLSPTACNRQMVKIYLIKEKNKKDHLNNIIMGLSGFEKKNINFFVVTFDISAFSFYGERNQGYFNSGLVAMNFVNALHCKNIGSCFLQWGNTYSEESETKKILGIPKNERIAVIIAAGYYKDKTRIPFSQRKSKEEIYLEI